MSIFLNLKIGKGEKSMGTDDLSFLKQDKPTGILEPEPETKKIPKLMGRPTKDVEEKKSESIKVYLTPQEKLNLEQVAKEFGQGINVPLAQLVRKALVDKGWI